MTFQLLIVKEPGTWRSAGTDNISINVEFDGCTIGNRK